MVARPEQRCPRTRQWGHAWRARKAARTYDARNRVATLTFPDANGNQSWDYTPDGLPETVTTWNDGGASSVINSYLYDKRRLPTSETQASGGNTWTVGYGYDANGHLSTLTYPDSLAVSYAPNALGQPTQAGSYASGVTYYPNGAIAGFTYGNGIVHSLTQNARGLPDVSKDVNGSTAIHQDEYAYDQVGNVTYIVDAATGQGQQGNRDMVYDALNRLTSATSPMFGTASYTYDVADNLRRVTVTGGSQVRDQTYVYDTHNRLTNVMAGGASVIGLGYDVQGNLANRNGTLYGFDYGNRLRSGGPETYRYDVQGRRIRSSSGAGLVYSLYTQSGQLLFQRDERSGKLRRYVSLGGSLVAESATGLAGGTATVTYQHTDALGSPVATTNSAKTVLQRSEYEPYGYLLNRPMEDGPGYTGHVTDAATGLVYMQQRYYDPVIGEFLSTDAISVDTVTGWNFCRYCYAANSPYKFKDPDGRIIDTLVDAAFTIYDTGRFLGAAAAYGAGKISGNEALASAGKEGLKETSGAVAVDAAAAAIPGLSVPMIRGAERIAAHADEAIAAGRAVRYEATTAKGAGQIERTTNISQDAMKANLADSGFKQLPSNGKVQVFSDGKTSYVFRSDKPTVEFKPNATGKGPAEIKIRTGVE